MSKKIKFSNKTELHIENSIWFVIIFMCFFIGGIIRDAGILGYTGDYMQALRYSLSKFPLSGSDGFYFIGKVFRIINVFGFTSLKEWSISLSIIFFPFILYICSKIRNVTFPQIIFICGFVVFFSACVCNICKEAFQTLFFYVCELFIFSKIIKSYCTKCIIVTVLLMACGATFRKYFLLSSILFLSLCLVYSLRDKGGKHSLYKDIPLFLIIVFLCMCIGKSIAPGIYNQIITVRTTMALVYSKANTLIGNTNLLKINNNNLDWIANFLISSIRIMFPIEFILKGLKYALFALVQIIFSVYLFGSYTESYDWDYSYRMAYLLILSFIIVELVWQVDLGTMFRHETTIFPLMLKTFIIRKQSDDYRVA